MKSGWIFYACDIRSLDNEKNSDYALKMFLNIFGLDSKSGECHRGIVRIIKRNKILDIRKYQNSYCPGIYIHSIYLEIFLFMIR